MTGKLAFVFPGQGSQAVGMLSELAAEPIIDQTFKQASQVLGYDLWELIQHDPQQQLNQTEYTQPAMLVADVALYRLWQSRQASSPDIMAGHSLGEYAALVCAEAISFEDAVMLVRERGCLMQQSIPLGQGAMAAIIGLTDQQLDDICKNAAQDEVVEPANFNAIAQTVIAGHTHAVLRAVELAELAGAKLAKVIPVSAPCHCKLLIEASVAFAKVLADTPMAAPQIDVINNVDVKLLTSPEEIRTSLAKQLYQPVRWVETIQMFYAKGVSSIIECGPGQVLTGLCKRIERNIKAQSIFAAMDYLK